ncbi:TolC family protein [Anaerophaga thermohalophila]|jgi:outer membrane protein|uniref:TolC family protein n=1 Tax=Anaerophaga thermohalophila TaxID=177400 RepID=UPI00030A34E6|nr:TolC family protein [Anaerophaga thermohalophila]
MRNKKLIILLFLPLFSLGVSAQETKKWTLTECIEYAKENNISIQQQDLNTQYQNNNYQQKKLDKFPTLNGNVGYQLSFGRVPDETTYEYVDQTTQFGRFSFGTSVPLFQGFALRNEEKQSEANWRMSQSELEAAKNDLAINITAYYLRVLFDKELLEVAREQYKVAEEQVKNTQKLVEAGRVAEGNLLEIKSQAAREAMEVTQMENNLNLSLLDLAQALDMEDPEDFDIVAPEIPELEQQKLITPPELFNTAVEIMPRIEAYEYNLESSEYALKVAKGNLYPSLYFDAGWSTNVSKSKNSVDFDFGQRFRDNATQYVGLTLRIPVFNNLSARTGVKNAKLGIRSAQLDLQREKQTLRKEIQQAYADAEAAFQKFQSARTAVLAYEESLRYTEKKYAVGLVSPVDYSVARADYLKAQSDFLQSKYEYVLRTKILDFYMGEELALD